MDCYIDDMVPFYLFPLPSPFMKELIHQQAGDFIFWKLEDNYSIILLAGINRKKEKEFKLNENEKKQYLDRGIAYIRELVKKKG